MNPQGQTGGSVLCSCAPPWVNLTWILFDEKGNRIRKESLLLQRCTNLCVRGWFTSPPPTVNFQLLLCWETSYLAALISLSLQFLFISFQSLSNWLFYMSVAAIRIYHCLATTANLAVLQTQQGVLTASFHCDDTLDQDHFPHTYLLSCHILKEHVRSHPDEQAAEKQRMTVVWSFQQLFRKSSNVLLMHITAKILNLILEKLHSPFPMATEKPLLL